jgi:DNA-directed RNA polymerase subunit K/omega
MEVEAEQKHEEKAKVRNNKFDKSRSAAKSAKKLKPNAETAVPEEKDNYTTIIMDEASTPPLNPQFIQETFLSWTQKLHDKDVELPTISAFTKLFSPKLHFTNAHFKTLEATRVTAAYNWTREAYEAMIVGVDENDVLDAEEAEKYAVYVSVLRMEKLQDIKRMLNIDFADIVSILEEDTSFTKELKDMADQWYNTLMQAAVQQFLAYFEESTPELPELYHDTATFVWPTLAEAHCRLGEVIYQQVQAEQHCVKPIPNSQKQITSRRSRGARTKAPLLEYVGGAGTDEAFTTTKASTSQWGEVGNQWAYACRSDTNVFPTPIAVESHIGAATATDNLDQIKKRASRLRTDAEALAKEVGMDVSDRFEDFYLRPT